MSSTTVPPTTICRAPGCGHQASEHWPHKTAIYPCRHDGCECTGFVPMVADADGPLSPAEMAAASADAVLGAPVKPQRGRHPGADLVAELHRMDLTERIRLLDWLAEHRTGTLRSALRDWKVQPSGRPHFRQLRPVVPSGIAARKPETRYPPPGE